MEKPASLPRSHPAEERIVILSGAQSAQSKDLRLLLHPGLSSAPADVISLCEISFGSSNNKIRLIHLNLNLVILVGSLRARSIERNLVLENLQRIIRPGFGRLTGKLEGRTSLGRLRFYDDRSEGRNASSRVVVEYLEVPLLKIGDRPPRLRRDDHTKMNTSGSRNACRGLFTRACRDPKQRRSENNQHALLAEHRQTSILDGKLRSHNAIRSESTSRPIVALLLRRASLNISRLVPRETQ